MEKRKYYVVWEGIAPGIYDSWEECRAQTEGFRGARFKAFSTEEAAVRAFRAGYTEYEGVLEGLAQALRNAPSGGGETPAPKRGPKPKSAPVSGGQRPYIEESIAVDAACSGNPGRMEYRGVYVKTGEELFRVGPYEQGTNNIGEFLAIVHGLAWLEQKKLSLPLYSDSVNAQLWVKQKKCRTKLTPTAANRSLFDLIARAEAWLQSHRYATPVCKWETRQWGEIPADFGRK